MKKILIILCLMVFTFSATTIFASTSVPKKSSDKSTTLVKSENKLSKQELNTLAVRVEAINNMDNSKMTVKEKRELRKELRTIKEKTQKDGVIYIGGATLLLIIILLIILL